MGDPPVRTITDSPYDPTPAEILMELQTHRLLIREFAPGDEQDVHEYASDPEVVRFMPWGPNTMAQTREFHAKKLAPHPDPRVEYELAIVLKAEQRLIGGVGMRIKNPAHREADIGYVLNRRYWNQGIMTEAARAMLHFGFGELGLHRIYATCDAQNSASAKVMQKLGMQYEGRMRQNIFEKGRWRDTLVYAILETDPR
jgi:RimJ/RimL family protein N-acetyltransferase